MPGDSRRVGRVTGRGRRGHYIKTCADKSRAERKAASEG